MALLTRLVESGAHLFDNLEHISPLIPRHLPRMQMVYRTVSEGEQEAILISDINSKAVFLDIGSAKYICRLPNTVERD